jgi:predicted SprT family Zn-dependent metalloprotease
MTSSGDEIRSTVSFSHDPEWFDISTDCSKEEFLSVVKVYARGVVRDYGLDVDVGSLIWEVSTRAKRRAGAVKHIDGQPTSISITWEYFQQNGWIDTASTVRHELIHVHLLNMENDPSHGPRFQEWAERLDTSLHCEIFAEPKWWVVCRSCESEIARYQKSKLVEHPKKYRCQNCGGEFRVEENQ